MGVPIKLFDFAYIAARTQFSGLTRNGVFQTLDIASAFENPLEVEFAICAFGTGYGATGLMHWSRVGGHAQAVSNPLTLSLNYVMIPVYHTGGEVQIRYSFANTFPTNIAINVIGYIGYGFVKKINNGDTIVPFTNNAYRTNTVPDIETGDSGKIECVVINWAGQENILPGAKASLFALRAVGAADTRRYQSYGQFIFRFIPVDVNNQFEYYRGTNVTNLAGNAFYAGYIKKGMGFVAQESTAATDTDPLDANEVIDYSSATADNAYQIFTWMHNNNTSGFSVGGIIGHDHEDVANTWTNNFVFWRQFKNSFAALHDGKATQYQTDANMDIWHEGYTEKQSLINSKGAIINAKGAIINAK